MRPVLHLALIAFLASCNGRSPETFAKASIIDRRDGAVGGPKALAQPGDFLLENDKFRVAIVSARPSMGPGITGGSIIDADLQWNDSRFPPGRGNDQLAEIIPTVNMNVAAPRKADDINLLPADEVAVEADGTDGGPAIVRVTGHGQPFISLLKTLWALVQQPEWGMVTDYVAEPGKPWLTIRTTLTPNWDGVSPLSAQGTDLQYGTGGLPILDWAIQDGLVAGDFYLQGGSVDVFAPEMGFDEDGEVYLAGLAGKNTIVDPFEFDFLAGTGDGISYGLATKDGSSYVPLFTSSQTAMFGAGVAGDAATPGRFPAGSAFTYERYFFIGTGDVGSIVDQYVEARGIWYGDLHGTVVEHGTGLPVSGADVFAYRVTNGVASARPWNQWKTDVDPRDNVHDGSWGGRLPVGDWDLVVHQQGRPDSDPVRVSIARGDDKKAQLEAMRGGVVSFTVHDELGRTVPAKITLMPARGATSHANPILGDRYVGGSPEMVLFLTYGEGETELPPGHYTAVATRGIEYELDQQDFEISDTTNRHVDLNVVRSVDTEGWVSGDLHVHSQPSHDSGVTLPGRVTSMVCEGVEFFSSTDHDFLTDFAPVIEDMGLEPWIQSAVGNEVTTVEIGHFLGFPLEIDHLADANGAMDWTGKTPHDIISGLRLAGQAAGYDPVVFVGHPRDGILGYFDQYGLDAYAGIPGAAGSTPGPIFNEPTLSRANPLLVTDNVSWEFDAMELLNGKRMELIRTPTQDELDRYQADPDSLDVYDMLSRTMQEQQDLENGLYRLGYGQEGQVDDWFTLLNLGFTYTAIGNSDTHGWTSVEAGCPRNYIASSTDDPSFIDDQEMADEVKKHHVFTTYGPFVKMTMNGHAMGDTVVPNGRPLQLDVDVQAPTWIEVGRVEVYENGTLIQEFPVDPTAMDIDRFHEKIDVAPTKDSWYVVLVMADQDLSPLFSPVEMPQIELQTVVVGALGGIPAVGNLLTPLQPIPRTYPVLPFAMTNPIWVDLAGDGFDPPGVPSWLQHPVQPGG